MNSSFLKRLNSILPTVNYSAITFDDLESPRLVAVYSVFWDVSLVLTTIFFSFMLFMIITKSPKEMSDYKWYLVHQLSWSYLFDLCIGLWKPVVLWPFYIGYSAGVFANVVGSSVTLLLLILVILAIGMGFSIFISLLHRYMQVIPFSSSYRRYSRLSHRILSYIAIVCLLLGALFVPLSLSFKLETDVKASLTSKYPVLDRIFELHPSMIGYDTSIVEYSTGYGLLILLVLFVVVVLVFILYLNFIRILKQNKTHLSAGTYKLQLMLFKALFIQMLLAGVLLILPITVSFILALLGFRWVSSFALFGIFVLGTHAFVDFIVICYYVRVYRIYVKSLVNKMLRRLGFYMVEPAQLFVAHTSTTVSKI